MNRFMLIISFVILVLFSSVLYSSTHRSNIESAVVTNPLTDASEVTRVVKLTQVDNMFLPAEVTVSTGEVIQFVIKNGGNKRHEMLIGDKTDLKKYAKMRRMFPDKDLSEYGSILLEPGEQKELIWKFDHAGTVEFACPLPGHFKKMRGIIFVEKK